MKGRKNGNMDKGMERNLNQKERERMEEARKGEGIRGIVSGRDEKRRKGRDKSKERWSHGDNVKMKPKVR